MKKKTSTYYFIGRLYPEELCGRYHPGEIPLEKGWILDVFHVGVCLWNPRISQEFRYTGTYAKDAVDIIVTMFNFVTNSKLKFRFDNWVEAKEVKSKKNIIGWYLPRLPKQKSLSPGNKLNRAWKRVGKFFPNVRTSFYHRLTLKDYQNCIDTAGDDAFFYAYRVVEDIRRAATQHLPVGTKEKDQWDEMHKILGTSKSRIDPLTEVSTDVRHGDINSPKMVAARENREQIINIAIDIMRREFRRSFKGLIR